MDMSQYLADSPPTVVPLIIKPHFEALTDEQKLYAHHISKAAFYGTRIILRQVSPESESIYDLIVALYQHCSGDWDSLAKTAEVGKDELQLLLQYFTQFLGNLGNYKGFGDVKFTPRCSPRTIAALAGQGSAALKFYERCKDAIYTDGGKPALMHFGFPGQGHMSTYYPDSPDITREEIENVGELLGTKGILPENTRIRKAKGGDYEVLIASALSKPPPEGSDAGEVTTWQLDPPLEGKKVSLVFGDHQEEMAKIALHIKKASLHAANDTQKQMMDEYAKSFGTGSLKAFKESQKLWVKDKKPEVESNIGFIETYRDPAGIRGEWEGMVAMVNKERTRAFQALVEAAPAAIPKLPWSKEFEKDEFSAPDFTSLEVLSFASSGIPAGINIPNYDDIRQQIGFKNVSLGNVLGAKAANEPIPFIRSEDLELYQENRDAAFEVQVGIHELLGYGTGKLLQETSPGVFNFDHENPPNSPVTGRPISTYYKPSETYSSVFGPTASSYEECRAECVAMALSCEFSILKIFGFGDGEVDMDGKAGDVLYASYLSMARAGVVALEFWDPKSRKWGQIHMQARYSILKTFLEAGDSFCTLDSQTNDLSDLTIRLDRSKILTHGRPAVEAYLQKLHIFKSTADVKAGRELYERKTSVEGAFWTEKVRGQVLRKRTPRKVFVMGNTVVGDNERKVGLREYESGVEGMIRSWAEREV
ncbi:peptidase family M49-domain-containing protein [Usnea florida]